MSFTLRRQYDAEVNQTAVDQVVTQVTGIRGPGAGAMPGMPGMPPAGGEPGAGAPQPGAAPAPGAPPPQTPPQQGR